jgi:hypothetical protein
MTVEAAALLAVLAFVAGFLIGAGLVLEKL